MVQKEKPVFQPTGDSGQDNSQNSFCVQGTVVFFFVFVCNVSSQAYICVWFIYFAKINHQAKTRVSHRDLLSCVCTGLTHKASHFKHWSHLVAHRFVLARAQAAVLLPGARSSPGGQR